MWSKLGPKCHISASNCPIGLKFGVYKYFWITLPPLRLSQCSKSPGNPGRATLVLCNLQPWKFVSKINLSFVPIFGSLAAYLLLVIPKLVLKNDISLTYFPDISRHKMAIFFMHANKTVSDLFWRKRIILGPSWSKGSWVSAKSITNPESNAKKQTKIHGVKIK